MTAEFYAGPENGAYCGLEELIRLRFGARGLAFGRQQKAFAALVGPHRSRFRGRGVEYDEVRVYQAGDDSRNMEWRVTARTGIPHTKLFREERERPVFLLVDQSLSMFFGSRCCFKSVAAARAAALLAWAALHNNDRVGGLVFNDNGQAEVRPRRSIRTVLRLLHDISHFNRRLCRGRGPAGGVLDRALEETRRLIRPGTNIFVISDFQGVTAAGDSHLQQLRRHNDISVVLVHDPLEEHLPSPGLYRFTDGERRALIDSRSAEMRRRYEDAFREKAEGVARRLAELGIPLLRFSTEDSAESFFRHAFGGRT